jgi:hypothetical protein
MYFSDRPKTDLAYGTARILSLNSTALLNRKDLNQDNTRHTDPLERTQKVVIDRYDFRQAMCGILGRITKTGFVTALSP